MAVPTTKAVEQFVGNDSANDFDVSWGVDKADNIRVYLSNVDGSEIDAEGSRETLLVQGTHYTVSALSGDDYKEGFRIRYPISGTLLQSTQRLTIARETPLIQDSFDSGINQYLKPVEASFDYLIRCMQELSERLKRTPQLLLSEDSQTDPSKVFGDMFDAVKAAESNVSSTASQMTALDTEMKSRMSVVETKADDAQSASAQANTAALAASSDAGAASAAAGSAANSATTAQASAVAAADKAQSLQVEFNGIATEFEQTKNTAQSAESIASDAKASAESSDIKSAAAQAAAQAAANNAALSSENVIIATNNSAYAVELSNKTMGLMNALLANLSRDISMVQPATSVLAASITVTENGSVLSTVKTIKSNGSVVKSYVPLTDWPVGAVTVVSADAALPDSGSDGDVESDEFECEYGCATH